MIPAARPIANSLISKPGLEDRTRNANMRISAALVTSFPVRGSTAKRGATRPNRVDPIDDLLDPGRSAVDVRERLGEPVPAPNPTGAVRGARTHNTGYGCLHRREIRCVRTHRTNRAPVEE